MQDKLETERSKFKRALYRSFTPPFIFIVIILVLQFIAWMGWADLTFLGVYPRKIFGLPGILTAPLVHGNFGHVFANAPPLLVLSAGILYFNERRAYLIFLLITVFTGLFVWLIGSEGYHIGASGLLYGCASYLVASGLRNKDRSQAAVAFLVLMYYGGIIWGVLPGKEGISWESHLGGFLSGIACAFIFRQPRKPLHDDDDLPEKPSIGDYKVMPNEEED